MNVNRYPSISNIRRKRTESCGSPSPFSAVQVSPGPCPLAPCPRLSFTEVKIITIPFVNARLLLKNKWNAFSRWNTICANFISPGHSMQRRTRTHSIPSPEPDTLDGDLEYLEQLANNESVGPAMREVPRQLGFLRAVQKTLRECEPLWTEAADKWGITESLKTISDQEIAAFTAFDEGEGDSALLKLVRKHFLDPYREQLEKLPDWDCDSFLLWWCGVFRTAIHNEYLRRRQEHENQNGRLVRRLLVETDPERGETLAEIGRRVARGLWFPDQPEEARSLAVEKVWEAVAPVSEAGSVATDPEVRKSVMKGGFNKVLDHARDHVRTRIETEGRHADRYKSNQVQSSDEEPANEIPSKETPKAAVNRMLIEQLLYKTESDERDRRLVEICLVERRSEKEAGALIGLTQGGVSKRLKSIRAILRNRAASSTEKSR